MQGDAAVTFATLPWRAILSGSLIGLAATLADAYDVLGVFAHNELKAVNAQFRCEALARCTPSSSTS